MESESDIQVCGHLPIAASEVARLEPVESCFVLLTVPTDDLEGVVVEVELLFNC